MVPGSAIFSLNAKKNSLFYQNPWFLIKLYNNSHMDSFDLLPDSLISPEKGEFSQKFIELGVSSFRDACLFVHNLEYGYNSDLENKWILFKEMKGSCTTKHGVIATFSFRTRYSSL